MVWYLAAGYKLPAGVEAYLLHYATELRRRGFDTRILVFERLPRVKHRYLRELEARRIPIESVYAAVEPTVMLQAAVLWLPWSLWTLVCKRRAPRPEALVGWLRKRGAVRRLARRIRRERPDLIHVKARLIAEAWPVLPSARTVYQHALAGTVDATWEPGEVAAFREFANRCARILVQGEGIAENLRRAFDLRRACDVVFTMAPDECGPVGPRATDCGAQNTDQRKAEAAAVASAPSAKHQAPGTDLRFGILCRFAPQKGIQFILEALRLYRERHDTEADFTFAGQGPLEANMRQFLERHGLKRVRIVPVETPVRTLRELDVFVHPGLDDAMPVSIVEALMCGVPCIATRVGAVPDLVRDGVEGLLIAPGSAAEILEAMERFVGMSPAELAAYRRRARARYESCCTPEVVGAQVAAIYREVLAAAGSGV